MGAVTSASAGLLCSLYVVWPCQVHATATQKGQTLETWGPAEGVSNFTCLDDKVSIARTPGCWWVGTLGGLLRLDEGTLEPQRVYTTVDGLAGTRVCTLAADGGTLWVGTLGGVSQLDVRTGTIRSARASGFPWRFEIADDDCHVWALSDHTAIRIEKPSGKLRTFQLGKYMSGVIREGTTLWGADREGRGTYSLIRLDTATGEKITKRVEIPDTDTPTLFLGRDYLWGLAESIHRPRGGQLLSIDKDSLEIQAQGVVTGMPHDHVQEILVAGADVWARTTGDWDDRTGTGIGGQLCRYSPGMARWQCYPSISGAKHDEPTCLRQLDGDLCVATRAYDRIEKMVVAWGMVAMEREAPVVESLTLNRFRRAEGKWQTFSVPASTNYDRIIAVASHGKRLWFLIEQRPLPQSREEWRTTTYRHRAISGYVDPDLPASTPVLLDQPSFPVAWDARHWGHQALDLLVSGDHLWVRLLSQQRNRWWRNEVDNKWQELAFHSPLADYRLLRLFSVNGTTIASGHRGAFRFDPRSQAWLPWGVERPWRITQVCRDVRGTWWAAAATTTVWLPADSERSDEDRKPLQSGLFRSRDGITWEVPDIAPWTWHHQDLEGRVRFMPVAQVGRNPQDLDLWGHCSMSAPRSGARRADARKNGEGLTCVQSDGDRAWIGTAGEGVFCLKENRWRRLWPRSVSPATRHPDLPCAPEDVVASMVLEGDSLWIATLAGLRRARVSEGVVEKIDNAAIGFETLAEIHPSVGPLHLLEVGPVVAKAGKRIWFSPNWTHSENSGIYCFDESRNEWECIDPETRASAFAGEGETVWIGTSDGLLRYNMKTRESRLFTVRDGLAGNGVLSVAVDDRFVWVSTSDGISKLDRARFETR